MGYRTVVVLYNDQASEWENDPDLGKKIATAMNQCTDTANDGGNLNCGGRVVECTHADTQTLAVIDGYNFQAIAHDSWSSKESISLIPLKLIKLAAAKMGFRLVKVNKTIV